MPNGLIPIISAIISAILGSSVIAVIVGHRLQQHRERETEKRAAHAAWVARQRDLCAGLMETVVRNKGWIQTLESVHDNLASRLSARTTFQTMYQDVVASLDHVRKLRTELDLEPNAQLQEALEHYGDALIAYQQALSRPFSSPWNPIQVYIGKTPADVLRPLAHECDVRTKQLQDAVRAHLARLETPYKAPHIQWVFRRRRSKAAEQ